MSEPVSDGAVNDKPISDNENVASSAEETQERQTESTDETKGNVDPSREPPYTHTRASAFWASVVVGLLVLLILIVFILENGQRANVSFFGAHWHLPQGVALLLAAVIGGLFVVLSGMARILQLRNRARAMRTSQKRKRHRSEQTTSQE
jgi:uncharacterized integral membrane protein